MEFYFILNVGVTEVRFVPFRFRFKIDSPQCALNAH